jgi:hypothetical protein
VNPKSRSSDGIDGDCPWGLGGAVEITLSKRFLPLTVEVGEDILGVATEDLGLVNFPRFEKGDDLSCCFWGEGAFDGKLRPLNASVNLPMFEDCGCGDARYPKEGDRSCWDWGGDVC